MSAKNSGPVPGATSQGQERWSRFDDQFDWADSAGRASMGFQGRDSVKPAGKRMERGKSSQGGRGS